MKRKYKFHVVSDLISFMNEGLLADYDQKKLAFKWIWTMAINCCFKSSYKNKDNFLKSFIRNYKLYCDNKILYVLIISVDKKIADMSNNVHVI